MQNVFKYNISFSKKAFLSFEILFQMTEKFFLEKEHSDRKLKFFKYIFSLSQALNWIKNRKGMVSAWKLDSEVFLRFKIYTSLSKQKVKCSCCCREIFCDLLISNYELYHFFSCFEILHISLRHDLCLQEKCNKFSIFFTSVSLCIICNLF